MEKTISKFILIFILVSINMAQAKGAAMSWFKNDRFTQLDIMKYKSISKFEFKGEISIKDEAAIADIMNRIKSLPSDGDEVMAKLGPNASKTVLTFKAKDGTFEEIEILNGQFKTPSTGFISGKNETEAILVKDIDALTNPDLNKRILNIKDQVIKFKDFKIIYRGRENKPQPEGGPTIGPTSRAFYEIWNNNSGNTTTLSIFSGQVPAQPQAFIAGSKKLFLLTFTDTQKKHLNEKYFVITDKLPKGR